MSKESVSSIAGVETVGRLVSAAVPCHEVTIAAFLRHARGGPRFCWESSREGVAFAGSGVALELSGWGQDRVQEIEAQARALLGDSHLANPECSLAAPRLFGGFSFRDDFVPDQAWADFLPAHFVLPHFQLVRAGSEAWLTINAHIGSDDDLEAILPELRAALEAKRMQLETDLPLVDGAAPALTDLSYPMPYADWAEIITDLTQRMQAGELNKVVLARAAETHFDRPPDIDRALAHVATRYPGTYRFLFEPRSGHAFFGATPELLVRVQGQQLETMALAGSARRGRTADEDAAISAELFDSAKDRHEHQIVVDAIAQELGSSARLHVKALQIGETGLLKLSNIQHLHTPIRATLAQTDGVLPWLARMHPTPALGGDPREAALAAIQSAEPVTRGWYAAPIGYIDRNMDGAFAVGIRSAVVQRQRAWLYAGVGLVAQSDPQREWDETILKFRPMLEALGERN